MKYISKPKIIEAIQWFKSGDHQEVEDRKCEIVFDRLGNYFYISHCDKDITYPSHWLAVNEQSEVALKNGVSLPFAFYEIKSGVRKPAIEDPELLNKYRAAFKWKEIPKDFGYIKTLEGGHIVTPGDFIIKGIKGEFYPCKPDIFEASYEKIDDDN